MMFAWAALVLALPSRAPPPPPPAASISGLWPKHGASAAGATALEVVEGFSFVAASPSPRLRRALDRYAGYVANQKTLWTHQTPGETLPLEHIVVRAPDDGAPPAYGDDETFELVIAPGAGSLRAASFAGALRGLEAFAQCTVRLGAKVVVNSTRTNVTGAAPKFAYRGVMVDSSRHFLPVPTLEAILDGMAASALNVLHWHLVDAQSFRGTPAARSPAGFEARGGRRSSTTTAATTRRRRRRPSPASTRDGDLRVARAVVGLGQPAPMAAGLRRAVDAGLYLGSDADHGDWRAFYDVHPRSSATRNASSRGYFNVTDPAEASRVLGAEACLWGERADGGDANLALWPRAAAAAEALYVGPDLGDDDAVLARLLRHRCRLVQRGIPAAPLQPGFC
ncbi:N-acetyl-beta-D-galactosaminidase [Aureococcus anophagefferens]|nr:N-acetyl-beta-D-galactosaminidase [Aureococcus anophagefferens]